MPNYPDSLTLEGLKRRVDVTLSGDDELLDDYLEAAFLQAQARPPFGTGRLLAPNPGLVAGDPPTDTAEPVTERIRAYSTFIRIPDAREITQVLGDDVEIAVDDYETHTRNGYIVKLELVGDYRIVKVTGRFGFTEIPADLADAIYTLAARAYYERAAQYADQVAVAEGAAVQSYFRQLPPRTKLVFASYTVASDRLGAG